jgi:excisionase family DNA binding protein
MSERWLSLAEIAAYLGVSKDSVYRWVDERRMPAHKVGRQWKFKSGEVDAWVRSGRAGFVPGAAEEEQPVTPKASRSTGRP